MKTIEPKTLWFQGSEVTATVLNAVATDVKLNTSASFNFYLFTTDASNRLWQQVNGGALLMSGQDYQDWDQDSFAWDWIAAQLGLTITGEYVPPAPSPLPTI